MLILNLIILLTNSMGIGMSAGAHILACQQGHTYWHVSRGTHIGMSAGVNILACQQGHAYWHVSRGTHIGMSAGAHILDKL